MDGENGNNNCSAPLNPRNRFVIPPDSFDFQQHAPRGPLLFPTYQQWSPQAVNTSTLIFPTSQRSTQLPAVSNNTQFPTSQPTSIPTSIPTSSQRTRSPNWSDAETRFLLELWRDNFPISKRRNSTIWDDISKKLNKILRDQGLSNFRTGLQCKARIKSLEDEYKKVKDHNGRSGNNRETFEYYEDMDTVLGCKPNITPKLVVEGGLGECSASSSETNTSFGDDAGDLNFDESVDDNGDEDEVGPMKKKVPTKGKGKGKRKSSSDPSSLIEYLEESQKKDHEFFERISQAEGERELKSQKLMMNTITEIAKIFKGDK